MTQADLDRCQRLLEEASAGRLDDVKLWGAIVQTRSEAILDERARMAERLRALALQHVARGETAIATVLAAEADALAIPTPPETKPS
jgi:hypothetical protein